MGQKYFKMTSSFRFETVVVWSLKQQRQLGEILAEAISQGRSIELRRGDQQSILVLVSPVDDMGRVTKIDKDGSYKNIGVTEKGL